MNDLQHKVASSAFVLNINPGEEWDIKVAAELGMCILLDKPLVVVTWNGRPMPPGLARVATKVITLAEPMDTPGGQLQLMAELAAFMEGLPRA